jgi:hypothetical protein
MVVYRLWPLPYKAGQVCSSSGGAWLTRPGRPSDW